MRLRRERRRRQRYLLNRHMLLVQAIIFVALAAVCAVCIFIDSESWPLAGFVFGIYVLKSEVFGELRNMWRWANHQERFPIPPSVLQTIYRGFPPIPVYIPTEIPPHVLERSLPDYPTEAEQKARRLLWSMLDPDQRLQYSKSIRFIVDLPFPYRRMLKPYAILGDGFVHWPDGVKQCIHPQRPAVASFDINTGALTKGMPLTDSVIAQLIHLRNDPGVLYRLRGIV